jgi:radical SAM protein with 4Fe4S-binding SPASM domain
MKTSFKEAVISNLLDKPYMIDLAITFRCNSKCVQCDIWKHYIKNPKAIKEELTIEEIRKIFSSYGGLSIIGLSGGEPTLRNDLPEIVDIIENTQKNLKILFITTNGLMPKRTKTFVKQILENRERKGLKHRLTLLVSLDGPKKVTDRIRGIKGDYDKAIETIEALVDLRKKYKNFEIGTSTVCSPYNIDVFEDVLAEIKRVQEKYDLEPTFCVWFIGQLYKNIGTRKDIKLEEFRKKLIGYMPKIKEVVGGKHTILAQGRTVFYDFLSYWLNEPTHQVVPCGGARVRYFINPLGDVFPCTIYNMKIGNFRDFDYDWNKLIKSVERKKVRKLVCEEKCPICCNTCETIPAMMASPHATLLKWIKIKTSKK